MDQLQDGLEVQTLDKLNVSFLTFPEARYLYKIDNREIICNFGALWRM